MIQSFSDSEGKHSGIIQVGDFEDLLSQEIPNLSERDKDRLCYFGLKGSLRQNDYQKIDRDYGNIHLVYMAESLEDVI
jgi:hypothetical protein